MYRTSTQEVYPRVSLTLFLSGPPVSFMRGERYNIWRIYIRNLQPIMNFSLLNNRRNKGLPSRHLQPSSYVFNYNSSQIPSSCVLTSAFVFPFQVVSSSRSTFVSSPFIREDNRFTKKLIWKRNLRVLIHFPATLFCTISCGTSNNPSSPSSFSSSHASFYATPDRRLLSGSYSYYKDKYRYQYLHNMKQNFSEHSSTNLQSMENNSHPSSFQPQSTTSKDFHLRQLPSKHRHHIHQYEKPITQVITDIDDTVKSSGGVRLAGIPLGGIDTQYPRGTFYPGVFQFALELSLYDLPINQPPLPVAVITARAREFKFALALNAKSKVAQAYFLTGIRNGFRKWGIGPVLYGSVKEWIMSHQKGLRKYRNFTRLRSFLNKGKAIMYIYIGDTGEKDREAGEKMLAQNPEIMRALFLHVVCQPSSSLSSPKTKSTVSGSTPELSHVQSSLSFNATPQQHRRQIHSTKSKSKIPQNTSASSRLRDRKCQNIPTTLFPHHPSHVHRADTGQPMVAPIANFLNDVSDAEHYYQDYTIHGIPVLHFRTYVGAARKAVIHGLMSIGGMMEVAEAAQKDAIQYGLDPSSTGWTDLQNDIQQAHLLAEQLGYKHTPRGSTSSFDRIEGI